MIAKKVAVQTHTVLSTGEYTGERGRELVNSQIWKKFQQGLPSNCKAHLNEIRID